MLLNEYFQTGNDFPWQELGEYQNLAALLPAILNIETPGPELKDKVARKLYRIKNEKRSKKKSGNNIRSTEKPAPAAKAALSSYLEQSRSSAKNVVIENEKHQPGELDMQSSGFETAEEQDEIKTDVVEPESAELNTDMKTKSTSPDEIDTLGEDISETTVVKKNAIKNEEKKPYQLHGVKASENKNKGKGGLIAVIILFIIIAAGFFYLYQKFSLDVNKYKSDIESLNKQVAGLTTQLAVNKEVDKILQMKDAHIINLYNTSINKEGSGKVIISFESSSGFLQLSDLPVLSNNKSYQLWMSFDKTNISLGICRPSENISYLPITLPEQNYKGEIKFFITEESSVNAEAPSGKIYLTGVLK